MSSAVSLLVLTSIVLFNVYAKCCSNVNTTIVWIMSSVLAAVTIRFPNAKIAVLTLSLLLFYDLFWVFFSEYFFKDNVMVEVASKETSNPIHDIGKHLNINSLRNNFARNLSLPIKLLMPHPLADGKGWRFYMLGLGDIAMPGSFIALTYRLDLHYAKAQSEEGDVESKKDAHPPNSLPHPLPPTNLFAYTMLGYVLGLCMAFGMSMMFNHA
eukprot:gene28561-34475_t